MQSENERDAVVSAAFCCEVVESAHVKCRRCRSLFFIFFFLFVPFFPFLFLCGLTFNFTKGNNGCCQGGCSFRFGCFTFVSFFFFVLFSSCVRPSVTENAVWASFKKKKKKIGLKQVLSFSASSTEVNADASWHPVEPPVPHRVGVALQTCQ